MTGFLDEVGKRLAVPGLLYLAAVTAGAVLGQGRALDYPVLARQVTRWAASPSLRSAGGTALIIAGILAGSVLAGAVAAAAGQGTQMLWVARGERWPGRWLTGWRRSRSQKHKQIADDPTATPEQVRNAMRKADRICVIAPDRPTWIG